MTFFSTNEGHVRADLFKPSGKWYETRVIDMSEVYAGESLKTAILTAWLAKYREPEDGWFIVVLEPHHKHAHPMVLFNRGRGLGEP